MRTPLAWRNVFHSRMRSFAALCGVSFAILLIFMQLGFHAAAKTSATLVYESLDFDLLLISPQYSFLARPRDFPHRRLEQVRGFPGVDSVTPFWIGWGEWRNPVTRHGWAMLVLAADPSYRPFRDPLINDQLSKLIVPDNALIDRVTRPEYGRLKAGDASEFERHRIRLVGEYTVGTGFVAGSSILTSDRTYRRIFTAFDPDNITLGLVKLQPGVNPAAVARQMNAALDPVVRVVTRGEIVNQEQNFWLKSKPIGVMFTTGVLVAFLVGAVILYQVLVSEVQNRLREYATLKALGYTNGYVYGVVLRQALIFSALGFVPAFLWALVIYALLRSEAMVPVSMELGRVMLVLVLTSAMCLGSTFLAVRKLRAAEPADLF